MDFLGDLGGLQQSLIWIAQFFLWIFNFFSPVNDLTATILRKTFWLPARGGNPDFLKMRQRLGESSFFSFDWQARRRFKKFLDIGEDAINRELDVTSFIKLQKRVRTLISVLFSKKDKYLLKHNQRFVLQEGETSNSGSDVEETLETSEYTAALQEQT